MSPLLSWPSSALTENLVKIYVKTVNLCPKLKKQLKEVKLSKLLVLK